MTTTLTPHDRLEALGQTFTPTPTVTYDDTHQLHTLEAEVTRDETTYQIDLTIADEHPEQNISAQVYRVRPWACLAMISYLDDELLEHVINHTINHDQEQ